jgi:hypothetical protein
MREIVVRYVQSTHFREHVHCAHTLQSDAGQVQLNDMGGMCDRVGGDRDLQICTNLDRQLFTRHTRHSDILNTAESVECPNGRINDLQSCQ